MWIEWNNDDSDKNCGERHRPAETARPRCSATSWQSTSGRTVIVVVLGWDDGRSRWRLATSDGRRWRHDVQLVDDFNDFTDATLVQQRLADNKFDHQRRVIRNMLPYLLLIITSDKGGGKCVCPRLSVCLLARLLRNACMDLDKMLRVDRCRDINELINFWARSGL